jgi:L-threonylcarbamoyladenylate synthase
MTVVLPAHGDPPPEKAIEAGVSALAEGDVIGIPTDTVYGLAADPWHSGAADRLFLIKGRPRNVELPVLVAGEDQALALATAVPRAARVLMERLWPGALTLVLPRAPSVQADLGEDEETIGLRCPDHPVPLALCRRLGPFAATSANRHGAQPITEALELSRVPGVALVLDAGTCDGTPSTVVDCTGDTPKLLRDGAISWDRITALLR